jgi:hypothetical protein
LAARPRSRESTIAAGGDVDLGDLLAMLPPRQRAVVALYYLEDLPVVAIAEALGVANGRSRHCCGRRGLHSPTDSNWSADVDELDRTLRVAARVTHERAAESLDIDAEMASTLPSSALSRARGGRMPPLRRSSRCGSCVSRADLH